MTSARIISEKFTGFDGWPFGSRRLCVPCAWAYTRQPTTQPALLITATTVTEYSSGAALADVLTDGPLSSTQAVVLPTARRRHILPTAQWGHLATDGLVVPWDAAAAARLTDLAWLRTTVGATWPQLSRPAPPSRLLRAQPAEHWPRILTAWTALQTWRIAPPLWATARSLTNPRRLPPNTRSRRLFCITRPWQNWPLRFAHDSGIHPDKGVAGHGPRTSALREPRRHR